MKFLLALGLVTFLIHIGTSWLKKWQWSRGKHFYRNFYPIVVHKIDFEMYDFFLSTGLANGSSIEPSKNHDQEQSFKEKIQLEHFKKVSLF